MIHEKDKQERQRRTLHAEREELQQATRRFIRTLFRSGINVALLPISRLPREPRQHFQTAGREFTRGWAALVREFADGIGEMAKETSTLTHHGKGAHPPGEAQESQET
jgi:hypothetical protein